jgi:hypothetical protein
VSLATKLKNLKPFQLASIAFYAVTGIILLAFLPFTSYPPHVGFLAIISLITAYSIFAKRAWAPWLIAVLIITITAFSLDILISVGFSNVLVALSVLAYLILTWFFSAYVLLKK